MVIITLGTSVCALAWLIEKVYRRPANKSRTTALQVEWTRNQWEVANKRTSVHHAQIQIYVTHEYKSAIKRQPNFKSLAKESMRHFTKEDL